MRTLIAPMLALAAALNAQVALAQFLYSLDAVDGNIAGSTLTGTIALPNSLAGDDVWNLGEADDFIFNLSFDGGLTFVPSGLIVSNDVQFNFGVGASVLTPVLPDASPGFAPDWRVDTMSGTTEFGFGIGHDLARPLWNLFDAGAGGGGPLDMGDSIPRGPAAWRLVLIPEPNTVALLTLAVLPLVRRRLNR